MAKFTWKMHTVEGVDYVHVELEPHEGAGTRATVFHDPISGEAPAPSAYDAVKESWDAARADASAVLYR